LTTIVGSDSPYVSETEDMSSDGDLVSETERISSDGESEDILSDDDYFDPDNPAIEDGLTIYYGPEREMEDQGTAPWGLSISRADYGKLIAGYKPRDMDEKWKFIPKTLEDGVTTKLTIARSWMGHKFYVLYVKRGDADTWPSIEKIEWEQKCVDSYTWEEQAKEEAIIYCREFLGCDFHHQPKHDLSHVWRYRPIAEVGEDYIASKNRYLATKAVEPSRPNVQP